jgi:type VI secretion system secreted protein VgrG
VQATPEHPFWANGAWTNAGELVKGDELLRSDGLTMPVGQVTHRTEHATTVYNVEVADWHTYLVSWWMFVVHNATCIAELIDKPAQAESGWLRVTTPYSGDGKGHMFTPEVGSQVLVSYEHGLAELPVVVGNVFHPQNKQGTKYSPPSNNLKGLQTAGGNKFVMADTQGDQKILISNSNNKGTAVEVGFQGDGSITIKSNGPVTVLSPTITLEAGEKGTIKLHAKTITMEAEELVRISSKTSDVEVVVKEVIAYQGREVNGKALEKMSLDGGTKLTSDSADSQYL